MQRNERSFVSTAKQGAEVSRVKASTTEAKRHHLRWAAAAAAYLLTKELRTEEYGDKFLVAVLRHYAQERREDVEALP